MAEEMENALSSYGKVSFKRFIDTVPMICIEIMQKFPEKINDALFDITDADLDRLVSAPQSTMEIMRELKREVETLQNGINAIKKMVKRDI